MTATLALPPRLDLTCVRSLAEDLADRAGADLALDAGGVQHFGALAAQLLLAAQRHWTAAGHRLVVAPRSAAFDEAAAAMGLAGALTEGGE